MAAPSGDDAWWDQSWNPTTGCSPASAGCTNCYAPRLIHGYSSGWRNDDDALHRDVIDHVNGLPVFNGRLSTAPPGHHVWGWPLKWPGAEHPLLGPGQPSLILTLSMGDLFIEGRPQSVIDRTLATLAASRHIGLVLSRHSHRMADYFRRLDPRTVRRWQSRIWCGFSAERGREFNQRWADMKLLADAGWFVFVSVAPMIAPVTLPPDFLAVGDRTWVICAGEVGPHDRVRPMDAAWARHLRRRKGWAKKPHSSRNFSQDGRSILQGGAGKE